MWISPIDSSDISAKTIVVGYLTCHSCDTYNSKNRLDSTPYVMWVEVEVELRCAFVSVCIQFSDFGVATCERTLLYLNVVHYKFCSIEELGSSIDPCTNFDKLALPSVHHCYCRAF